MLENSGKKEFLLGAAIFLSAALLFSAGIRPISYSSPDEKRYIQSAREMAETGDWLTPRYHGRPRFQKPILFYWLAALSVYLAKGAPMASRIPSLFFGAMTVLLTYMMGRDLYNRKTGLFCASLLAISWLFSMYSRLATPDMAALFFTALSLFVFVRLYFKDAPDKAAVSFFVATALAVLTKGLVGLFVPLIVICAFAIFFRKERPLKKLASKYNLILGPAVFLAIALPWFIVMIRVHGDAYLSHIWQVETLNRIRSFGAVKGLVRYLGMTFVVFLPASVFLPGAIINAIKCRPVEERDAFSILWIFAVIAFFTLFGTKKTHYLLLLAPPLSVFMGAYLTKFSVKGDRLKFIRAFIGLTLIGYLLVFGLIMPAIGRDDGLLELSNKLLSVRREGEPVGVGSHFISHNRLDLYLGINVKKVNIDSNDPKEQIMVSSALLKDFMGKRERTYCFITRQDYEDYIPAALKKRLSVLGRDWYWKKPNQLRLDRETVISLLKRKEGAFKNTFKNEIYLISNRP